LPKAMPVISHVLRIGPKSLKAGIHWRFNGRQLASATIVAGLWTVALPDRVRAGTSVHGSDDVARWRAREPDEDIDHATDLQLAQDADGDW